MWGTFRLLYGGFFAWQKQPVRETSPGKNAVFPSIYLPHLHHKLPDSLWASVCLATLPNLHCLMWFLFVRPEVCLRLPSDSSSPRTPLPLAMCLALSTRTRDFHPLDCAHAGRTKKKSSRLHPRGLNLFKDRWWRKSLFLNKIKKTLIKLLPNSRFT